MENKFLEKIDSLRDEDIIRIAFYGEVEGYEADAVSAAQKVADKRGLSNTALADISYDIENDAKREFEKPRAPLSIGGRVLFALGAPFILPSLLAICVLSFRGYARKSREALISMLVGLVVIYAVIALVFFAMDMTQNQ